MTYILLAICSLGMYKGWQAFIGCVQSSALKPAFNMLLITALFLSIFVILLYAGSHNIQIL